MILHLLDEPAIYAQTVFLFSAPLALGYMPTEICFWRMTNSAGRFYNQQMGHKTRVRKQDYENLIEIEVDK